MAVFTVSNTGGNYSTGSTWVGGVSPAITDTVAFTSTSGNLTITSSTTCAGIDYSNYLGTITINATFRIDGNINFGTGGYVATGSNTMYIGATGTITSNGTAWTTNFGFLGTSQTYTLADNLTINGLITCNLTTGGTLNGFNLYINGSYNQTGANLLGTTNVHFTGTGSWNHTTGNYLGLNVTINTSGTITFGANGVRYGGSKTLTYVTGTVVTTNPFYVMNSCSLDVAPITFNAFQINGTSTVCTLLANVNINGELRFNGATACTVNGFNLICNAGVYIQPAYTVAGTTIIQLAGTGTWTHQTASFISLPIVINTAGTITFNTNGLRLGGNTLLQYVAGTLAGNNFLLFGSNRTLDLNSSIWLELSNTSSSTITLLSDLHLSGELNHGSGTLTINGLYNVYIGGNLRRSSNTVFSGTASLIMNGTGTWSDLYQAQIFGFDLTINTAGTITISGTVRINENFTYIAGTVITTGSLLVLPSTATYNLNGINFDGVQFNGGMTRTFLSNFTCETLTITGSASIHNGAIIYTKNLSYQTSAGSVGSGSTKYVLNGTGTWSHSTTGRFSNDLDINCGAGTLTLSGFCYYQGGTIKYISGTVSTASGSLNPIGCTLDTDGMTWRYILLNFGTTITLNSKLNAITISYQLASGGAFTFNGTHGFVCDDFSCIIAGQTINFLQGKTYIVNNSMVITGTTGSKINLVSTSTGAFLNLLLGGTQNITDCNVTWINSSGGQTMYTSAGVLTNTVNWGVIGLNSGNMLLMF